jgi:hypothetical protein
VPRIAITLKVLLIEISIFLKNGLELSINTYIILHSIAVLIVNYIKEFIIRMIKKKELLSRVRVFVGWALLYMIEKKC